MWTIKRKTQNGKLINTVLARGASEAEAWAAFNQSEQYRNYSQTAIFVAVCEKDG
jgi:hypothetical protein